MSIQTIFSQLTAAGVTPTGALALMGNWKEESGLEPCRLQGDFQNDRWASKNYAARVDGGVMLEEAYYRDGRGWGLAQWTFWTRKKALLDLCHERGASIADEAAQIDFSVSELRTQYAELWSFLCSCDESQLYGAVSRVCKDYERPAYNNIESRYRAALTLRDELQPSKEEEAATFWPPRMIDKGMRGADVTVLQAILVARGYSVVAISGSFDDSTDKAVRKFQKDNGLVVDGVVGPMTWGLLLGR